jgi:hypothetical protein
VNEEMHESLDGTRGTEEEVRFTLSRGPIEDGELVPIGPTPALKHPQLAVPSTTNWTVLYPQLQVRLEIGMVFSGQRFEIETMTFSGVNGHFVQSRDLTQLALPSVIQEIAKKVIPGFEYWTIEYQDRRFEWASLKVDDEFLAQLMWAQQVSHGNPRKTLMEYFEIPRSTSSYIIRRLRKKYAMPDFN